MSWSTPHTIEGIENAQQLAVGDYHACVLNKEGSVSCWGWNLLGQLGDGTTESSITPVEVEGLSGIVAVEAGFAHSCAIDDSGEVTCWGWNRYGQLGNGSSANDSASPVVVPGAKGAVDLSLGYGHSCALFENGSVKCWGWNAFRQLGDGTSIDRAEPVEVNGLEDVVEIELGGCHACARDSSDDLLCWGANGRGQLGSGDTDSAESLVSVLIVEPD